MGKKQMVAHGQSQTNLGTDNTRGENGRPLSNYNYDEAVLKVQEWNEALKCESNTIGRSILRRNLPRDRVAPSRPSKHPQRKKESTAARPNSPPLQPLDFGSPTPPSSLLSHHPSQTSLASAASWKPTPTPAAKASAPPAPLTQIQAPLPMPFVSPQREEETDNWDDDFEEGISFSKLQGQVP